MQETMSRAVGTRLVALLALLLPHCSQDDASYRIPGCGLSSGCPDGGKQPLQDGALNDLQVTPPRDHSLNESSAERDGTRTQDGGGGPDAPLEGPKTEPPTDGSDAPPPGEDGSEPSQRDSNVPLDAASDTPANSDHTSSVCQEDDDCAMGLVCEASGTCVPGCRANRRCADGYACCDGGCVSLASDMAHCGRCDMPCAPAHAVGTCQEGICHITNCVSDYVDCDGLASNGCEAQVTERPSIPALLRPSNGAFTGSARPPANAPLVAPPLRPTFVFGAASGAVCNSVHYELQIDSHCTIAEYQAKTCPFQQPEIYEKNLAETRFTPGVPLPVNVDPAQGPVGRRYYWRARACDRLGCTANWSAVRYVNVGRLPDDIDGDGMSDLALEGHSDSASLEVGIHYGGSDLTHSPNLTLTVDSPDSAALHDNFFAWAGDVDGDGYSDLAVGGSSAARVALYLGGPRAALTQLPRVALEAPRPGSPDDAGPAPNGGRHFGLVVAGVGDTDEDGFGDLLVGDPGSCPSCGVHLFHGAASSVMAARSATRVAEVADADLTVHGMGDIDGSGRADLAIRTGRRLLLYRGEDLASSPVALCDGAGTSKATELVVRAGDLNGDDQEDAAFVVRECADADCASAMNVLKVVWGSNTDNPFQISTIFEASGPAIPGWSLAGGQDLNADGLPDLLVGPQDEDRVLVLLGSRSLPRPLGPGDLHAYYGEHGFPHHTRFGRSLGLGDYDGDGIADPVIGADVVATGVDAGDNRPYEGVAFAVSGNADIAPVHISPAKPIGASARMRIARY